MAATQGPGSGRPPASADALLLNAALESMPYGFSIWDGEERLVLWNQRYADIYAMSSQSLRSGMALAEVCELTIGSGNHPGTTPAQLFALYHQRLEDIATSDHDLAYEKPIRGRVIRATYARQPGIGTVVTHVDVTDEKDRLNALQQREAELQVQNMRFVAAIDNMSQGLCMFDHERRLVICNRRYADMYGLPRELLEPGTPIEQILRNRVGRGVYPVSGAEAYVQGRLNRVMAQEHAVDIVELRDGRTMSVLHHPMPDGGWVATHQDITEQRRTEARVLHLARHDSLTDLPNRVVFRERMEAAEARIRRGHIMAILYIDLDHFKAVNDLLGHAVGDAVLKTAAVRLRQAARKDDVVSRLGGDEFAILHGPLADPHDASVLADRVVRATAEPFDIDGHQVLVGASVGIAVAPLDGVDAETLMKNADLALYRAKAEGRGTYHFFESGMDAAVQERLSLEIGLRAALGRGELALLFQPLISLTENRICGLEALLRWNHPERGVIMPDVMIPIAEESGLIVPIGEWVLREACRVATQWPEHVRVAVNLSPVQFKNRNLVEHVAAALNESGLAPGRLDLEVTESVLLADNELTLKTLHRLRALGTRISMDDFGTGYSSLSYLRSFPFDKIKIDRSFVSDIARRGDSLAIIQAVIGLGRSLGMATTAEGIETADQLDLVRERGCTEVQGYLFSPPLPASAVAELFPAQRQPQEAAIAS